MSDYEQNPINGSQPPQGDSQPNTGYTPYQQPGTYYTPPQPARLTARPQSRRSRASRKKRRTKRPLPSW